MCEPMLMSTGSYVWVLRVWCVFFFSVSVREWVSVCMCVCVCLVRVYMYLYVCVCVCVYTTTQPPGQDLLRATLDALQIRAKNPLAKGHVLYFGGCSAGGRGALFTYEVSDTYTHTHTHIHTHTHTHIHTHIHTHTHTEFGS